MPNDRHIVYLIDDNAIDRMLLARTFVRICPVWTVSCFDDASAALEAIRTEPSDLVLTDYQLAALDGVERAKIIRESGFAFPIVALSAALPEQIDEMVPEGLFNLVLSKPLSPKALDQLRGLLA